MNRRLQLMTALAARNDAKGQLDGTVSAMRAGLAEKGIAARVTERVADKAADTFEQAVEIASTNKAVVAGTMGALALWLLRKPLLALAANTRRQEEDRIKDNTDDR